MVYAPQLYCCEFLYQSSGLIADDERQQFHATAIDPIALFRRFDWQSIGDGIDFCDGLVIETNGTKYDPCEAKSRRIKKVCH